MRTFLLAIFALCAVGTGVAAPTPTPMTPAECAVWQRELGFAQSVANHDAAVFASFLHPGAVFIDDSGVARGAQAVIAKWSPLLRDDGVRLHWYPERVVIGGDLDTALSMGPYWIEDPTRTAEPRFRVGRFISTWKRDRAGTWHVLFDGGNGGHTKPATTAEIRSLQAKLPQRCPT